MQSARQGMGLPAWENEEDAEAGVRWLVCVLGNNWRG